MLEFEETSLETPGGYFSFSDQGGATCESTETLDAMISSQIDMENLIKKNFMMQSEKLNIFAETNPVQLTLREEVEIINQQNADLHQKIKKLQDQIYSKNKDNDTKDIKDEEAKYKKMESDLCITQMSLLEEEKKCKNLESH